MNQILSKNEALLIPVCGYDVVQFEALYRNFAEAWQAIESRRLGYAGRQTLRGAGRKYRCDIRIQLLSVLLWANLRLHPRAISRLLCVHVSTFTRIRQRVLTVLCQLNVSVDVPDRTAYRELEQLAEVYQELLQLPASTKTEQQ